VKPGDIVTFSLEAADQYGQPFPLADVEWTASGGSIDTTGSRGRARQGFFTVHAIAGTLEASTDVRVAADGPASSTDRLLRCAPLVRRGATQKWMNFYTKVVTGLPPRRPEAHRGLEVPVAPTRRSRRPMRRRRLCGSWVVG